MYYGRILEQGTSSAYEEDPRKRRGATFAPKQFGKKFKVQGVTRSALALQMGNGTVFAAHVTHPPIAPHPFFYETLGEMREEMMAELQQAFEGGYRK